MPDETKKVADTKKVIDKTEAEIIRNTPGVLVLQWLTYAFWGWTVFALTFLTAISVGFYIERSDSSSDIGDSIAYSLAAVIVLFIISIICDAFYSRREPLYKHGASTVIMIIHAVIFALFAIGAVIAAVFSIVNMVIGNSNESDVPMTVLITSVIIAVVYGATLLRTIRPFKLRHVTLVYGSFMAVVAIGITILGIAGPAVFAAQTKDDRLIESGLTAVSESIQAYASENNALPKDLSQVREDASENAQALIDRNLVEYTPQKAVMMKSGISTGTDAGIAIGEPSPNDIKNFYYQLCVTYKARSGDIQYAEPYQVGRPVTPDTYAHKSGKVCYDLATTYDSATF